MEPPASPSSVPDLVDPPVAPAMPPRTPESPAGRAARSPDSADSEDLLWRGVSPRVQAPPALWQRRAPRRVSSLLVPPRAAQPGAPDAPPQCAPPQGAPPAPPAKQTRVIVIDAAAATGAAATLALDAFLFLVAWAPFDFYGALFFVAVQRLTFTLLERNTRLGTVS
jgi:hypothetical protein